MSVEGILTRTLDLLGQEGFWIKGDLYRFEPENNVPVGACLVGCMELAAGESSKSWVDACERVETNLNQELIYSDISEFNDADSTTLEDVILLVKKSLYDEDPLEKDRI